MTNNTSQPKSRRDKKKSPSALKRLAPFAMPLLLLLAAIIVVRAIARGVTIPANTVPVDVSGFMSSSERIPSSEPEPLPESSAPPMSSVPANDPVNYVTYGGPIEHIFVHPLVAYPELAFDGDGNAVGMDEYMTTVEEFKRILEELYKNDYILVYPNQIYGDVLQDDGTVSYGRLNVKLPRGKKPVILSTDDINYYPYMQQNGCNLRLAVGEDGHIAEVSVDPKTGNTVLTQGNEVFSILNDFLKTHPDFSFEGAKAIVGLTGYNGILGYHTQADSDARQQALDDVAAVIKCLRDDGFLFASHSYGHGHFAEATADELRTDCAAWEAEVASLVGKTELYIFPYGEYPEHGSEAYQVLVDAGFRYFSGVGLNTYQRRYDGYWFDDRKNLDGITLRSCLAEGPDHYLENGKRSFRAQVWDMMDVSYVFDEQRGTEPGQGVG